MLGVFFENIYNNMVWKLLNLSPIFFIIVFRVYVVETSFKSILASARHGFCLYQDLSENSNKYEWTILVRYFPN